LVDSSLLYPQNLTMNLKLKIGLIVLLFSGLFMGCRGKNSISISNKLTTFIPEEKILIEDSSKKLVEASSGNFLRDAIRMINTDERTVGYYKNLSLVNSAISENSYSYTFSGLASSTINEYPANQTQQIVVTIEMEQEELFYELNFGSNP